MFGLCLEGVKYETIRFPSGHGVLFPGVSIEASEVSFKGLEAEAACHIY